MDRTKLQAILAAVASGELSWQDAFDQLKALPYEELGFAKIDSHRALRQGFPEVIFCPGKTPEQIANIARQMKASHHLALATRADATQAQSVLSELEGAVYDQASRIIIVGTLPDPDESLPPVAVVSAGTADLPIAEEAAVVLTAHRIPVRRLYDVGVAGIHRLFDNMDTFKKVAATIVVAGMDGALPSVIGGIVEGPVIAVPTSVGYGASFHGLAALLTMLNSCAAGLTVVNIDNGFGAAMAAVRIVSGLSERPREASLTLEFSTSNGRL
ncbi:MAG TPA: nickel pincer cofactor biosynthesis protein LarB [Candidatus Obscuribacterales bacterium]